MTFEGFDTAPLIETSGFVPAMGEVAGPDAATLDTALREAARAERAAIRADATMLDLWVDSFACSNLRALERPALGAGTSWHAWAATADDGGVLDLSGNGAKQPALSAGFGDEGEGDEEIVVKGSKPKTMDDDDNGGNIGGYGDGSYGDSPDGGGVGEGGSNLDQQEPNDCRDRNALEAKDEINAQPDDHTKEYGSLVYRDADGAVHHSPPLQGNGSHITLEAVLNWMSANGVSMSQVIALVHNHDEEEYATTGDEARANRYPSENDWDFAGYMVNHGAGGNEGAAGFAMYVIDTTGRCANLNMRIAPPMKAFPWQTRSSSLEQTFRL